MASGLLSLKWNHHRSTFLHVLATIRQKESYSDVTLACAGKFYSAHKLVLSTCSEYFEEMFERTQCKHPVIVLKDIGSEELEALLSYMYDGEVNVLQENLSSLIKAAECLKIKGLAVADHDPSEQSKDKSSSSSKDVNRSHSSNSNYHSDSNNSNSNRQFRNNSGGGLKRPIVNKQEDTQPLKRRRPADPVHSSPVRRTSTDKSIISNNKDRSSSSKAGDGESSQPAAGGGGGSEAGDENNSMDDPGGADDQASSDVPDDASRSFAQGLSEDTGVKAEPVEILDSDDMGYDQHADAGASHDASDHEFTEEKFSGGAGGSDAGGGDPNSLWGGGDPADLFSQPSTSSFTGQEGSNTENTSNGGSKAGGSSTGPVPLPHWLESTFSYQQQQSQYYEQLNPYHQIASLQQNLTKDYAAALNANMLLDADDDDVVDITLDNFIKDQQSPRVSETHISQTAISKLSSSTRSHACPFCSFSSTNPIEYQKHLRCHQAKQSKCPYCEYTTARNDHLKIHIRCHTGEKPYKCDHCDYRCAQKSHLNVHMQKRHPQILKLTKSPRPPNSKIGGDPQTRNWSDSETRPMDHSAVTSRFVVESNRSTVHSNMPVLDSYKSKSDNASGNANASVSNASPDTTNVMSSVKRSTKDYVLEPTVEQMLNQL